MGKYERSREKCKCVWLHETAGARKTGQRKREILEPDKCKPRSERIFIFREKCVEPKHTHARITDWVRFRLSEKKYEESVEVNEMVGLKSEMMRGGHLIRFTREACTGQWVKQPVGNAIEMYQKN